MRKGLLTNLSVLMAATLAFSAIICPTGRVFAADEVVTEDEDSTSDVVEQTGTKIDDIKLSNQDLIDFVKGSDIDSDGYISEYEAGRVTYMAVTKASKQSDLTKILALYPNMTELRWNSGTEKTLTFEAGKNIQRLYITTKASQQISISGISQQLDSLGYTTEGSSKYTFNFSKSSAYKKANLISLSGKQISGIKLSGSAVSQLYISNTSISKVDVSSAKLTSFSMYHNNKLKSVSVKNCSQLKSLGFWSSVVTNVKINGCSKLSSLTCDDNKLTKLDVSKYKNLISLSCGNNKLTKLDVTKNSKLDSLSCNENKLTSINTSKNKQLSYFSCSDNKIKKLSLSSNKKLNSLRCYGNKFTKVNLKKNKELNYMYVGKTYKLLSSYVPSVSKYDTDYIHLDIKRGTKFNIVKYAPALKNAKFSNGTDSSKTVSVSKKGVISVKKGNYASGYIIAKLKKKQYQIRVLGV